MAELLNCPFCNNDVNEDEGCFQVSGFRPPSTPAFSVRCGNPSCNAEVTATSRESAIAAWNRRAPPPRAAGGEPLVYGMRKKGERAVIGLIPPKVHALSPTVAEYLEQYEEVALYDHPPAVGQEWVVPDGWHVSIAPNGRDGDAWEIYDETGSGGIVSAYDVKDWVVRKLLDSLASRARSPIFSIAGEVVRAGDDEEGFPRLVVRTTRLSIQAIAVNPVGLTVNVIPTPAQPAGGGAG